MSIGSKEKPPISVGLEEDHDKEVLEKGPVATGKTIMSVIDTTDYGKRLTHADLRKIVDWLNENPESDLAKEIKGKRAYGQPIAPYIAHDGGRFGLFVHAPHDPWPYRGRALKLK